MSDYPLTEHALSHILSELADWQREQNRPLTPDDIKEQLCDAGYGSACFAQVLEAWNTTAEAERLRTPITIDVSKFGEASFTVVPNFDPGTTEERGVNLEILHEFLPKGITPAILITADEAERVAEAIRRAAAQTRGDDPDMAQPASQLALIATLAEDDHSKMYSATLDAMNNDAGNVREMATAMLLAMKEGVGMNLYQMMHELTEEIVALQTELGQ